MTHKAQNTIWLFPEKLFEPYKNRKIFNLHIFLEDETGRFNVVLLEAITF